MRFRLPRIAVVALLGGSLLGGCAALKATTDPEVERLLNELPLPKELAEKISYYQKYAAKFRKFHDSGELDEGDVLDVLRDAGIISPGPSGRKRSGKTGRKSPGPKSVPPLVESYGGGYVWPTSVGVVSSEYGKRWGKNHRGLDIAADIGEPIRATATGVVIYSGSGLRGYGNVIILRHDAKTTSLYAHNSRLLAAADQRVEGGQVIAKLGNTGRSTGPHLHFEIRDGDVPVNPRTRLGKSTQHADIDWLEGNFSGPLAEL